MPFAQLATSLGLESTAIANVNVNSIPKGS